MKKLLLTFVLLVGIVFGLMAQKLTYQAVIRDNNQQLVVNTAVKATVTIDFTGDQADYTSTITDVSTNIHGLLTFEFGNESLAGRDWTNATIAVKVVNASTPSTVYVNDDARPVSAVPYALSVNGQSIQNYLTDNHYVTETQVGQQIRDSIASIGVIMIRDETLGAVISAPTAEICELVMQCIGDTLGKLNAKIENLQNTVVELENIIDNLSYNVDYFNNLTPDGQPCLGAAFVKDAQNNKYSTVKIGSQCWMKENLRTNNVNGIGNVYTNTVHNYDVDSYGRLYDRAAVMQGASSTNYPESGDKVQGICPNGWHVPSKAEWETLSTYVSSIDAYQCDGGNANALSGYGWNSPDSCCAGYWNREIFNKTGFSAVPAGFYAPTEEGIYLDLGNRTFFWSATDSWAILLSKSNRSVQIMETSGGSYSVSVRCLRDAGIGGKPLSNEIADGDY